MSLHKGSRAPAPLARGAGAARSEIARPWVRFAETADVNTCDGAPSLAWSTAYPEAFNARVTCFRS